MKQFLMIAGSGFVGIVGWIAYDLLRIWRKSGKKNERRKEDRREGTERRAYRDRRG